MSPSSTYHPGEDRDRLGAYLAGELSVEERAEVEEHLADCDACRSRLVELHFEPEESALAFVPPEPLLGTVRNRENRVAMTSRRHLVAAGLAAAVFSGGLWIFWDRQTLTRGAKPDADDRVFRVEDAVQTLELLAPVEGVLLPRGPVDLRWTPVVDVVHYRVMVLDLSGVPIVKHRTKESFWEWTGNTGDGFWYVEAELTDGTRLESEPSPLVFESADAEP